MQDDRIVVGGNVVATGGEPDWSPDGRLAWVRDGVIYIAGKRYHRGSAPSRPGTQGSRSASCYPTSDHADVAGGHAVGAGPPHLPVVAYLLKREGANRA